MKRSTTALRFFSVSALTTLTRMVCPRTMAASVALATMWILPSSISLRPNGGEAQPISTWSVITVVSVVAGLPVAVGLAAVSLNSLMKARTILWVDEPLVEKAMVWPSASLIVLIAGFLACLLYTS